AGKVGDVVVDDAEHARVVVGAHAPHDVLERLARGSPAEGVGFVALDDEARGLEVRPQPVLDLMHDRRPLDDEDGRGDGRETERGDKRDDDDEAHAYRYHGHASLRRPRVVHASQYCSPRRRNPGDSASIRAFSSSGDAQFMPNPHHGVMTRKAVILTFVGGLALAVIVGGGALAASALAPQTTGGHVLDGGAITGEYTVTPTPSPTAPAGPTATPSPSASPTPDKKPTPAPAPTSQA